MVIALCSISVTLRRYNDSYCSLGILRSARAMVCLMRAMVCVTQARRHTSQCWVNLTSTTNFLWCEHMFMKRVEIARSHLVIFKGFHIVKLCNKLLHSRCFSTHAHASLLASKRPSLGPIEKCLNCNKNHSRPRAYYRYYADGPNYTEHNSEIVILNKTALNIIDTSIAIIM